MLKHGILGLLNYGSMTGYEINKIFKDSLNYFWDAQTSQIYRELQTLKKNGWASDETIEQESKPDKKLFSITESGKQELKRWLSEENTGISIRSPLIMKTFFRGECTLDENIAFFKSLKKESNMLNSLMTVSPPDTEQYSKKLNDTSKALYWKMTVEYGLMFSEMYGKWIDKCISELEEIKNEGSCNKRQS